MIYSIFLLYHIYLILLSLWSPSGSLGCSGVIHGGALEALKDGLPAEVRPLMILGGCQQEPVPLDAYIS